MVDRRRELSELRAEVAQLDLKLLEQLEARARLSRRIHALLEGEPTTADPSEHEWLAPLEQALSGELTADSARAIFRQIRAEARALEHPVRVTFFGSQGGFGHAATAAHFGWATAATGCASVVEALDEVLRGRAAFAVIPFETSSDGLIQSSITALAATELVIVDERTVIAEYDLVSRAQDISAVKTVYVTPNGRSACEQLLAHDLAGVHVVDVRTPDMAAGAVAEDESVAAVMPSPWQDVEPLPILRRSVGDGAAVKLRFGIVSARPAIRSGKDTTALLFSVSDAPGSLFEVLRHFAERGVNLRKLHSRALKTAETWESVFYVEADGHVTDRPMVTVLEGVKRSTRYLKVLGSFPARW
jgi:chorismate mutase/prephenate dehydratase